MIEQVIFDADLTLIDSFKGVHQIYCLATRDAGLGLFLAVTTGHTSRDEFMTAGVPEGQILDSVAAVPKALKSRTKGI